MVLDFLDHLETERGNSPRSRNSSGCSSPESIEAPMLPCFPIAPASPCCAPGSSINCASPAERPRSASLHLRPGGSRLTRLRIVKGLPGSTGISIHSSRELIDYGNAPLMNNLREYGNSRRLDNPWQSAVVPCYEVGHYPVRPTLRSAFLLRRLGLFRGSSVVVGRAH